MADGSNVTLKAGRGYESPWITIYGTPDEVRSQIQGYFGLSPEEVAGRSVAELVIEASSRLQELAAGGALGKIGTPIQEPRQGRARPHVSAAGRGGVEPEPEGGNRVLLEEISIAGSREAVIEVYSRNKGAFEAEQKAGANVLRAALKARLDEFAPANDEN